MAARAILLSRESIKAVAGNDGTYKRGVEVQASNKMTEVDFSGEQLIHGKAKCEGSSLGDTYLLKFELDPSTPGARPKADCTCPSAQRGLCKHIVALLLIRADKVEAEERLRARERLAAARAEASGKAVLNEDLPPPPPAPPAEASGPSEVATVFQPMVTSALAAGTAMSGEVGAASTSRTSKRTLPTWMQPKAKQEKPKKGRASGGGSADIRTLLGPKKRPLEVTAKFPPKRRARGTKVARGSSDEEEKDEDDVMDEVAPRERPTRRAAAAGRRAFMAEEEEAEEGEGEGVPVKGTLGWNWDDVETAQKNIEKRNAQKADASENHGMTTERNAASERNGGTERNAASERNGGTERDELWDGEDDPQEPSITQRASRAKPRRAEGAEEASAPVRAGRKHNRRTVIDDEDEESAGARLAEAEPGARQQEKMPEAQAGEGPSHPHRAPDIAAAAPLALSSRPGVPKKKPSIFSSAAWKTSFVLDDEEALQLQSTAPQLGPLALDPLTTAEPAVLNLDPAIPYREATVSQSSGGGPVAAEPTESAGQGSGLPALLSDVVEEVAEKPPEEAVDKPSGEFNPLESMSKLDLDALLGLAPKIKRRAFKLAAKKAEIEALGRERPPPAESRPIQPKVIPQNQPVSKGPLPEQQKPAYTHRPVSLAKLPRISERVFKSTEAPGLRLGPTKKKVVYGDLLKINPVAT